MTTRAANMGVCVWNEKSPILVDAPPHTPGHAMQN